MAFTPDAPVSETVKTVSSSSQAIDTFYITSFTVDMVPKEPLETKMRVRIVMGYDNAGTFVKTGTKVVQLSGTPLTDKMGELVTNGATHRTDLRDALYDLLQAEGHLETGTVS